VIPGLYQLGSTGLSTEAPVTAAQAFLSLLRSDQRKLALLPVDSCEVRNWLNGVEMPYGMQLRGATNVQKDAALNLIRASMSERGYEQVWGAMRLNEVLGDILGDTVALNRWNYSIALFGVPSREAPWGWQLQGHHLTLTFFMVRDQIALTPLFIGAEPAIVDDGPLKGLAILQEEERQGLEMLRGLDDRQLGMAVVGHSITGEDLPPGRVVPQDERIQSGFFKDNAMIPYEGLAAAGMTSVQQRQLVNLVELYVSRMPQGHDRIRMAEIERYMDETHFAWIGKSGNEDPFYYKIHSPVILIEFDHHPGMVLDNKRPEKFHVHTQVRAPNGNDYGRDLLRQHYEEQHKSRRSDPEGVHGHAHCG
jgi:Protein of unknown function (DUF3500)